MPNNILHVDFKCPICCTQQPGAWEFSYGALAGEDYFLDDHLQFEESFSFFAQTKGDEGASIKVEASAECSACEAPISAWLWIETGKLSRLDLLKAHSSP